MSEFSTTRRSAWLKRKRRVGKRLHGTAEKPRLTVFRSHRGMYAQLVDDDQGATLASCDVKQAGECELPEGLDGKRAAAYRVGKALAEDILDYLYAKDKRPTAAEFIEWLIERHDIEWRWVKGHNGTPGNEEADALANRGIDELP